jgi:hypothetical protein
VLGLGIAAPLLCGWEEICVVGQSCWYIQRTKEWEDQRDTLKGTTSPMIRKEDVKMKRSGNRRDRIIVMNSSRNLGMRSKFLFPDGSDNDYLH